MKKTAFFLLISIFLLQSTSSAQAQPVARNSYQQTAACFSLDVAFLIDQSGSMSGFGGAASDPNDNRKFAVVTAIDQLVGLALDQCPDSIHRVAVISYGTKAQVDLPFREINPDSFDASIELTESLQKNVKALDLGQTQPHLAFELAKELFDRLRPISGTEPRKRIIIFITDGIPYPADIGSYSQNLLDQINADFPVDSALLDHERCISELYARYNNLEDIPADEISACHQNYPIKGEYYNSSTYLWMLLFRASDFDRGGRGVDELIERYDRMASSHAGELIRLEENAQDIPTTFREILSRLSGVQTTRLSCGKFAVNPYLERATLTFFKYNASVKVELAYTDASGNTHTISNGLPAASSKDAFDVVEYKESGANERYVFNEPYPGLWSLDSDNCSGLDAYYEEKAIGFGLGKSPLKIMTPSGTYTPEDSFTSFQIPKVNDAPYIDSNNPYHLQYQVFDEFDQVVRNAEDDFFGLKFGVTVTDPMSNTVEYEMVWNDAAQLFKTSTPVQLPHIGEYLVKVSIEKVYKGYPYAPIDPGLDKKQVYDATIPVLTYESKFNVVCPNLAEVEIYPWPDDIDTGSDGCKVLPTREFSFEIIEPTENLTLAQSIHGTIRDGWPLPVNSFGVKVKFTHPVEDVLNFILDDTTSPLGATVRAGGESRSIVLTQDPVEKDVYVATVTGMEAEGAYQLIVSLDTGYYQYYRPEETELQLNFNRVDGPWNRATTYFVALAILIALIVAFIIYQVLIRTNKVMGTLVFVDAGTGNELETFGLYSGKNWLNVKMKGYEYLGLKKLRASNRGKVRTSKGGAEDQDYVTEGMDPLGESRHPGIKVRCKPVEGSAFTVELDPDFAMGYGDVPYEMVFKLD